MRSSSAAPASVEPLPNPLTTSAGITNSPSLRRTSELPSSMRAGIISDIPSPGPRTGPSPPCGVRPDCTSSTSLRRASSPYVCTNAARIGAACSSGILPCTAAMVPSTIAFSFMGGAGCGADAAAMSARPPPCIAIGAWPVGVNDTIPPSAILAGPKYLNSGSYPARYPSGGV